MSAPYPANLEIEKLTKRPTSLGQGIVRITSAKGSIDVHMSAIQPLNIESGNPVLVKGNIPDYWLVNGRLFYVGSILRTPPDPRGFG